MIPNNNPYAAPAGGIQVNEGAHGEVFMLRPEACRAGRALALWPAREMDSGEGFLGAQH
jgi:hypothetical protein